MTTGLSERALSGAEIIRSFQDGHATLWRIDMQKGALSDAQAAIDAGTQLHENSVGEFEGSVGPDITDEQMRAYFVGRKIVGAEERRLRELESALRKAAFRQAVTITPRDVDNNPLARKMPRSDGITHARWTEEARKKPTTIVGTISSLSIRENVIAVRPQRFNPLKNLDGDFFEAEVLDEHGFPLIEIEVRQAGFRDRQRATLMDKLATHFIPSV